MRPALKRRATSGISQRNLHKVNVAAQPKKLPKKKVKRRDEAPPEENNFVSKGGRHAKLINQTRCKQLDRGSQAQLSKVGPPMSRNPSQLFIPKM